MIKFLTFVLFLALAVAKPKDWLIHEYTDVPEIVVQDEAITIDNGLVRRAFRTSPGFACTSLYSYTSETDILRTISPEAIITFDDKTYNIGDLLQDSTTAYQNLTDIHYSVNADAFHFVGYRQSGITPPYKWTPGSRGTKKNIQWPPKGIHIEFDFKSPETAPETHKSVVVTVHYEIYTGYPLFTKYITVGKTSEQVLLTSIIVDTLETEVPYNPILNGPSNIEVGPSFVHKRWFYDMTGMIYIETNYAHSTVVDWNTSSKTGRYPGAREPVYEVKYTSTLKVLLDQGFTSFRVFLLITDASSQERHSLAIRRMKRLLAPQIQENPIFFHGTETSLEGAKKLIDNIAEVGFEMLIFTFGTDFNYERIHDASYVMKLKNITDYAKSKGIEVGGYDLITWTRDPGEEFRRINPETHASTGDACFASGWVDYLTETVDNMMDMTGLSVFETDGPYPGYECESTKHKYHKDVHDSTYFQTLLQGDFYRHYRERNVYINQPDYYIYQGGNKHSMGYDESQFSLPREQQLLISRQTIYDNTYYIIPSEGWMFLPIVQYHGGGDAASFIPLEEHIQDYELGLAQYLGAGAAACYRGPYIWDTEKTKGIVQKWVNFYKQYRELLNGDIIHIKRATNTDIDMFMHVDPFIEPHQGLLMIFNPLTTNIKKTINIPVYYTGIENKLALSHEGRDEVVITINRDYSIDIDISMEPKSVTYYILSNRDS
ncbi:hypothetical protein WA158_008267 [Blastocystis sp. Blastoise]